MVSPRGVAARFGAALTAMGLVALGAPGAQAGAVRGDPLRGSAPASASDINLPPVPVASVTIRPEDLSPGEAARAAVSRLAAEPGVVLRAYAPLGGRRGASAESGSAASAAPARDPAPSVPAPPLPRAAALARPAPSLDVAVLAPVAPASLREAVRASLVATAAVEIPTGSVAPAPLAAPPLPGADAPASATPAPEPAAGLSAEPRADFDESSVLDATAMRAALEAFVGPESAPAATKAAAAADAARRKAREAVEAVYAERGFAPFWVDYGRFTPRARSVLARIDHAAEDGLDLRSTPVVVPRGGAPGSLAEAELSLTLAAVAYGQQASGGRIDPSRIAALLAAKPDVADAARILGTLSEAADAGEALRAFNPPQTGYALLRAKLAETRQAGEMAGRGPVPYGPTLKPGMRDARVPLIRARFGLDLPSKEAEADGLVYDTRVAAAVADFQRQHGMPASGVLTIRTVAALSGGDPRRLEGEIVANMERWRWLPRDLGETRIEVNIPDFSLNVMHGDAIFHHARVVVGKPDHPTPVFSETMRFIIVNPYWNVPLSIVKAEMLPKLATDPDYFANHGYEVVERDGVTYVRQPPGDSNALGHIKFMFPNRFSVYLHDTNARALFGNDNRALSHGCVRVDRPFALAEAVLGRENGWTEARVKRMVGGTERTINLPQPLPLHIEYFTAFVDDGGVLRLRDDVYGYSAKVRAALGYEG